MIIIEDTGLIHLLPPHEKHVTHGTICPCDPYVTAGKNVVIHRSLKKCDAAADCQ